MCVEGKMSCKPSQGFSILNNKTVEENREVNKENYYSLCQVLCYVLSIHTIFHLHINPRKPKLGLIETLGRSLSLFTVVICEAGIQAEVCVIQNLKRLLLWFRLVGYCFAKLNIQFLPLLDPNTEGRFTPKTLVPEQR